MAKTAFITGATSGIGQATARLLAQNNYRIIATGRRQDRLDQLENDLKSITQIITLNFDVQDNMAVKTAIESLPQEWREIDLLLNNAGNAHGMSSIQEGSLEDWD